MSQDGSSTAVSSPLAQAITMAPIYPMYLRYGNGRQMLNTAGMFMFDYGDGQNAGLKRPAGGSGGANGMFMLMNTAASSSAALICLLMNHRVVLSR